MTEEANMKGSVPISVNQALLITFALGLVVGFGAGAVTPVGISNTAAQQQPAEAGSDQGSDSGTVNVMEEISMEDEPVLGEEDAPVTMVMYEDFECPFCKKFETNAFQDIKKNYVDTGKVKVVWKDLPLPERIHPWADDGAAVMECVYRQDEDAFWKVKDKVFQNQDAVTESNVNEKVKQWASEEGVSESDVQACLDQGVSSEIQQDKREAGTVGAKGTPTVFIENNKLVGAQPYSRYKSVIENELSG